MSSGVYQITNTVNNKFYIGSTKDIPVRIRGHKWLLKNKKHHCRKLQNAVNKYGIETFSFTTIANCPEEYLIKLEQWFLDHLKPYYNILPTAGSNLGFKHPVSFYKKMNKPLLQYSLKGEFLCEWESAVKVQAILGINRSNITHAIKNNNTKQAGGYIWKRKTKNYSLKLDTSTIDFTKNKHFMKKLIKRNKDGTTEIFESGAACARDIGVSPGYINAIASGRESQKEEYQLKYL